MVVPTGIITSFYLQNFFKSLVQNQALLSLFDFENQNRLFPIHRQFRFCLLTIGGDQHKVDRIPMAFYCLEPEEVQEVLEIIPTEGQKLQSVIDSLPREHKLFAFTTEDFKILNPNTLTSPVFRTRHDAQLTRQFYGRAPILIRKDQKKELSNPWQIKFLRMFDMASDSGLFVTQEMLKKLGGNPINEKGGPWEINGDIYLPLYEGKLVSFYDHRFNSVGETSGQQGTGIPTTLLQHRNPSYSSVPRYWVKKSEVESRIPVDYRRQWFIGYRGITRATDARTMIPALITKAGVGHSLPLILSKEEPRLLTALLANLSSIPFDYVCRQKYDSAFMSYFYVEQFPVLEPSFYSDEILEIIAPKVLELVYTSHNLKPFAEDLGYYGEPFSWDEEKRARLKVQLDALYAHLYGISRNNLEYILDHFSVLRRNDIKEYGDYRTKFSVLEAYDEISPRIEEII